MPREEVSRQIGELLQHHTAEHILSGLSAKLYGFKNVGFHIGRDCTTVDFDGELTLKQAGETEYLVNRAIWEMFFQDYAHKR